MCQELNKLGTDRQEPGVLGALINLWSGTQWRAASAA